MENNRALRRLLVWTLAAAVVLAIPFFIWGEAEWMSPAWIQARLQASGPWLPGAAIGLLMADVVLPVPATVVMTVLGLAYGWAGGTAISLAGVFASGLEAYLLARWFGRPGLRRFLGAARLEELETAFDKHGTPVVLVSRALPILPEAASVLAGLGRMSVGRFLLATGLGGLPVCALYAGLGAIWGQSGVEASWWVPVVSAGLPVGMAAGVALFRRQ